MNGLTYLNIEMSDECQMTALHPECPRNADRFRGCRRDEHVTVFDAIAFYQYAVREHGFRGMLAPQFYSEPLATPDTIRQLMDGLPEARFCLRTNGLALAANEDIIARCAEVWVTPYPETDMDATERFRRTYRNIRLEVQRFDDRISESPVTQYDPRKTSCYRPRFELDVDYHGNGRVCCGDWRGEMSFGNILDGDYGAFVASWKQLRDGLWPLLNPVTPESYEKLPRICRVCIARTPTLGGRLA